MGGTIAAGGGSAVMQVPPAVAGASGGGPSPIQAPVPVQGGGPVAGTDLASAIAALQAAVDQLAAAVQAMQGAGTVQGGGPGGTPVQQSGCGCGGGSPTQAPPGDPGQGTPGQGTPAPAPEAPPSAPPPSAPPAPGQGGGGVRERIVQIAKAELAKNVTEDAGEDKDSGGNIVKYRTAVTGPGEKADLPEPWCADFASWVWKQAGVPFGKDGRGEDWTVAMIDWAKKQGTYHARGSYDPKPGDFLMVDWEGGQGVDHVAVVTEVSGGRVHYIAGNESDKVKAGSFAVGDAKMMGFITPQGG